MKQKLMRKCRNKLIEYFDEIYRIHGRDVLKTDDRQKMKNNDETAFLR